MLFSDSEVAQFINSNFEPVWVSVREVPRLTLDFGNGHMIRRTLHGNIATWVCGTDPDSSDSSLSDPSLSDSTTIDILPGIYQPTEYVESLSQLLLVHQEMVALTDQQQRVDYLKRYHDSKVADFSLTESKVALSVKSNEVDPGELLVDTWHNQSIRRQAIHKQLSKAGFVSPDQMTKWLYREVLNADLDDPYLGLGHKLYGSYPFESEESMESTSVDTAGSNQLQ